MLKFKVNKAPITDQIQLVKNLLVNMKHTQLSRSGTYGVMLTGDPGIGKTTFLKSYAKLLGIDLTIIEAPHVIEEHMLRLPFIVYDTDGSKRSGTISGSEVDESGEFKLVYSNSFLLQELKKSKKVTDSGYISYIYEQDQNTINLYEGLGGTKETAPQSLTQARKSYNSILFIDEYFRNESPKIRNIFRGILNGDLGDVKIPANIFITYASNMNDEGLAKISDHQVFTEVEMKAPTKDNWFSYLINKFKDEKKGVELNDDVLNKFHKILEDHHISFTDTNTEASIRTSPRRWEQLILYVNASIPAKNEHDAAALLANVKSNFVNADKETSLLSKKVEEAVKELIEETSGGRIVLSGENAATLPSTHWQDQLRHQFEVKMKLQDHRQYIPVIAGKPGIGKTNIIDSIAKDLGLKMVVIPVPNLNKDDVIGTPLSKKLPDGAEGEELAIQFSKPKLLTMIENQIKSYGPIKTDGRNNGFKYVIFFDELDKVENSAVFNAVRKVLLEKEFANGDKIPDGSFMVAAINPSGTEGSHKFTGHVSDVVDMIHGEPDKDGLLSYLKNKAPIDESEERFRPRILSVVQAFMKRFGSQDKAGGPFYLRMGGDETVYVSPRDYTNIFKNVLSHYSMIVEEIESNDNIDDISKMDREIKETVFEQFKNGLVLPYRKAFNDNGSHYFDTLKEWFLDKSNTALKVLLEDITIKKTKVTGSIDKVLEKMLVDDRYDPSEEKTVASYFSGVSIVDFAKDLDNFLESHLKSGDEIDVPLHRPIHDYFDDTKGSFNITTKKGLIKYIKKVENDIKSEERKSAKDQDKEALAEYKESLAGATEYLNSKEIKNLSDSDVLPGSEGEIITKSKAHKNTYNIFKEEKVDHFMNRLHKLIEDMVLPSTFSDTIKLNLEEELKKLEDKYLMNHVRKYTLS